MGEHMFHGSMWSRFFRLIISSDQKTRFIAAEARSVLASAPPVEAYPLPKLAIGEASQAGPN
jgi:hypothetical protein